MILGYIMVTSCGTNMDIQASCVFGDGCLFPCRCNDQATCDPHTGSCSDSQCREGLPLTPDDPGRFNWRGPACQIGNVAYGKPSAQSGVYEGMVSGYAVDGVIGGTREAWYHGCAHTDHEDGEAAWLYVNLQSLHQIHNVTVYNTFDSGGYPRMSNFSIRVGNTSDVNQHTECARKWETVGPGGLASLECQEKGRFVSFRREGGNEINLVTICEFVVIGKPITKEGQTSDVIIAKWKIIAISAALGFLLFVFVVVILVLFSKRDRTKSSSRSTATVDQASPVAEGPAYANLGEVPSKANYAPSNHYESLTLDPMNDGNNQYASIEADYEEISEKDLS